MEINVNREKSGLKKFMKTKAHKEGLQCKFEGDKFVLESEPETDASTQTPVPVMFKGEVRQEEGCSVISGKFSYGFYLSRLVLIAIALIATRLLWSLYKFQKSNIILCIVVTVLLVIVCIVTNVMGKPLKQKMIAFLNNLETK